MEKFFGTVFGAIWEYIKSVDKLLLFFCLTASATSLVLLYSIIENGFLPSNKLLIIQSIAILLGIGVAIVVSLFDYHTLAALWKLYLPVSVLLVLLTFTPLGITREGSDDQAWLPLGPTTFQPSELLSVPLFSPLLSIWRRCGRISINRSTCYFSACTESRRPP